MSVNLAQFLTLERPLAVLDLETTGFDADTDRIIQISLTMHYPARDPIVWASYIDPQRPILNAAESHKITDDMVRGATTFEALAPVLAPKITNVDIMGYNVEFDVKFLRGQFKRVNVPWPWQGYMIDAFEIYRKKITRTLADAYVEYGGEDGSPLPRGTKLEGAHDAAVDVSTTEIVLRGQLLRHADLPRTPKGLQDFCFPAKEDWIDSRGKFLFVDGVPHINFGKHVKNNGGKSLPMTAVPRDYYQYMMGVVQETDMKEILQAAAMGVYPTKKETM